MTIYRFFGLHRDRNRAVRDASLATSRIVADEGGQGRGEGRVKAVDFF